jgi:hypothetical protein
MGWRFWLSYAGIAQVTGSYFKLASQHVQLRLLWQRQLHLVQPISSQEQWARIRRR